MSRNVIAERLKDEVDVVLENFLYYINDVSDFGAYGRVEYITHIIGVWIEGGSPMISIEPVVKIQ